MYFSITSDEGQLMIGDFQLFWGNPLSWPEKGYNEEFGGYFGMSYGTRSIEFGDIDQGCLGIHYTVYSDSENVSKTLVRFN